MEYIPKTKSRKGFYVKPFNLKKHLEEMEQKIEIPSKQSKWKYIDRPHETRLSKQPKIYKPYEFSIRSIDKTVFGDIFYMKYILNRTTDVCVLIPNLDQALDAIQFFYEISKIGVPMQSWSKLEADLQNYPSVYQILKNHKNYLAKNLKLFNQYLKSTKEGWPKLQPSDPDYNSSIYNLIDDLLETQKVNIDMFKDDPFLIPDVTMLKDCLSSGKRYIAFFLRLVLKDGYHANMIIMDTKSKTVERFEPQGENHGFYKEQDLDEKIKTYFDALGYSYIPSSDICKTGVQDVIEGQVEDYDFGGFCKTWSLLYALLRLVVIEDSEVKDMEHMIGSVMKVADDYFNARQKGIVTRQDPQDVDFVIEFLYEFIPEILEEGKEEIKKINDRLGTTLVLEGRTIHSKD